jgi:hypothetical protein
MTIQSISAMLTDRARELVARSLAEDIAFSDWSFQVGTSGFDTLDPTLVDPVDPTLQALVSPVGSALPLGRVTLSGAAASASLTTEAGVIQIDGLAAIPASALSSWLFISGAASSNLNGLWSIRSVLSATSVTINAPLATAADAGPLSWELRESCTWKPNASAASFHGRLIESEAVNLELGEVAIFCRIVRAPITDPGLLGQTVMFANAHHTAMAKNSSMVVNYHVVVQV